MSTDFFERLQQYASDRPNEVALHSIRGDQRQALTWRTLLSVIDLLGQRLQRIGSSRPVAHVALLAEDSPGWAPRSLPLIRAGWVIVPLDPSRDSGALSQVVRTPTGSFAASDL